MTRQDASDWEGRRQPFPARAPFPDECVTLAAEAIRSGNLCATGGSMTARFETDYARLYDVKHAVAVSSGTAAIHTAIAALDPAPGSEVITAPITDAGTVNPILFQNCVPIFADLDDHLAMDPASIERVITDRTAAILVVHLFGNATDVEAIGRLADRRGIPLIEDCSQAHLTPFRSRLLGRYGSIGTYSFQQSKHLTTGDGGMVVTDDEQLAARLRLFRDKGWSRTGLGARSYPVLGLNYRMTELQAAVGIPQLERVAAVVAARRQLAARIDAHLSGVDGVRAFEPTPGCDASYWCYPFFVDGFPTADFAAELTNLGVPATAGYIGEPIYRCLSALHDGKTFGGTAHPMQPPYHAAVDYRVGTSPRAEEHLRRLIVLPIHEGYTDADADDIGRAVITAAARLRSREAVA